MNWVAIGHLCWVLLFVNGITASDHDISPRPTSLRLPKQRRPLRSNNSIKKGPEVDFKFSDDPRSTTVSALNRLSSKRTTNVDYLARNTVPVAAVTETIRKSHRPPPAHLLAYQALSTTERGSEKSSEPNLSPTGWALASLVPSKNATPPLSKRNTVVSGTAKPFNNYWSSRLSRPVQRTTPITPTDSEAWIENEKNHTDSEIPVENLVKHDNHTSSHDSTSNPEYTGAPADPHVSESTFQPTERANYLEKPLLSDSNKHTEDVTTSHKPDRKHNESTTATHHSTRKHHSENATESHYLKRNSSRPSHHDSSDPTDTDQHAGNNLIKEVKGADLGSSILNGIVLATVASKYAEEAKQEKTIGSTPETNSTRVNVTTNAYAPFDPLSNSMTMTTQKSPGVANTTVAVVPDVTHQPDQLETASQSIITRAPSGKTLTSSSETAGTQINVTTIPSPITDVPPSSEPSPNTLGDIFSSLPIEKVTNKMADLLENFISPTTPSDSSLFSQSLKNENGTAEVILPVNTTENPESSTHPYSRSRNADSVTEMANSTAAKPKANPDNSTTENITITTESSTTTLSNGLLEPHPQKKKHSFTPHMHIDKHSTEISPTTLSQDVNDIPEAFTHVKDRTNLSISSSQGTDNVLLPTSTLPPATTAEPKSASTPSTSYTSTSSPQTKTSSNSQHEKALVTTTFSPMSTTHLDDNFTTPTEVPVDSDPSTSIENGEESSPSTVTKGNKELADATNETHTTVMTTLGPIIYPTEGRSTPTQGDVVTTNNVMENTSEIMEITTQFSPKHWTSYRPRTTTALPPKLKNAATVPMYSTSTSTKIHFETEVTEKVHIPIDADEDHDDTLKYNVTITDISDKKSNSTEQEPDYNDSDKDEDDNDKETEVPSTTTLIIIEEITTKTPSTKPTTRLPISTRLPITTRLPMSTRWPMTTRFPITTTQETPSTTEESAEDGTHLSTEVPDSQDDSALDQTLRLTFQASYKEMCLVKNSLTESIATLLKEAGTRNIYRSQVRIINLGMSECSSKSLPLADKVPVILQITDVEGKGDQNLTELLYAYLKQGRFNFKYQLRFGWQVNFSSLMKQVSNVEMGAKPLLLDEEDQWGGTVIAAIVISSVAGVSLCCLTILLMIMRKRQKGFTTYGQRCTPVSLEDYSLDNISVFNSVRRKAMRASKRSYGNPAFDDPVTVTNPLNFVGLSNMANSHTKIDTEYSEVPTVSVKPDELPLGAESKNRYANVIPIPETRVPLLGSEREEVFINANYVKGAKGAEKFYIACQAPLDSTIADFWMMIWEQQTQVILMLTDLHENGVEKCADYLPPSEVLDCHRVFGDLQVTLKKREVQEKYIISSLQLKNLESNLWREVIHLWYTGWPIRGVPDDLTSIIAYLIEARSYSKPGHPIVVHCSPGTGRTGTIIAIDISIRDFETDRIVDIPKTVYSIRRDRAGAVQTNLQYYLIYQVIHLYATKLAGGGLDSI